MALPQFSDTSDFHCVTTWSQFDMEFSGVAFFTIAELVRPKPSASHVFFKSFDGYSTNNPLDVCMDDDVMIAHTWNGKPISKEHGGPARIIIPKRYAWKGAKFIREITFSIATSWASGKCAAIPTALIPGSKNVSPPSTPASFHDSY